MLRLGQRLVASERAMRILGALLPALRLWHPEVRRDPYPTFRRMRERRMTRMRLFGGWIAGRYEDVERRVPDNRKAARLLGHVPGVTLEEGLPRTIAWQREAMSKAGLL